MIVLEEVSETSLTFRQVSLPHSKETGRTDFTDSATRIAPVNELNVVVNKKYPSLRLVE